MNFTFGIITGGSPNVHKVIDSIERLQIPEYEIIVVGGSDPVRENTIHVPFDETKKPMWITKKKNIITEKATYDNIVYTHDYIVFDADWYKGYLKAGDDFEICMNRIVCVDGTRFRDWILLKPPTQYCNKLPYTVTDLTKHMYISGSYWVAKKHIMQKYPLDERLSWGQGEDVEWSKIVREKCTFSINAHSTVRLLKRKDNKGRLISRADLEKVYAKANNI